MSASKAPLWFRYHSAEMILRCEGLSAVAGGILLQLFPRMHQAGDPIRRDHAALARLCGTTKPAFERALAELKDRGLIIEKSGGLWSDIIEIELDHHADKSAKSTKSVSKRWEKTKENQRPADTFVSPEVEVDEEASPTAKPSTFKGFEHQGRALERATPNNPVKKYRAEEAIDLAGHGMCWIERVRRDRLIVRSDEFGTYLRVPLDPDGIAIPSQASAIEDENEGRETA